MTISVIIPTYNRVKMLIDLLHSLEKQSYKEFEVIIVSDGSKDNTCEVIKSQSFDLKKVKIINRENHGRAATRNHGAKEAQGELLIFLDDDMAPATECIEVHLNHHLKYTSSIMVGRQITNYKIMNNDFQRYRIHLEKKWENSIYNPHSSLITRENLYITSANFSISKKLFDSLQGFDSQLTDLEDFDLAVRAYRARIPIHYIPAAHAYHNDIISCTRYIKRQKEYRLSFIKLFKLKKNIHAEYALREPKEKSVLKKLIYFFFSFRFWSYCIDNVNWLIIFPKNFRYRLYEIIIAGSARYSSN